MSTSAISEGRKFKPIYATQDFSTVDDGRSFFPGIHTSRISLDSILSVLTESLRLSSGALSLNHVLIMTPLFGVYEILKKVGMICVLFS